MVLCRVGKIFIFIWLNLEEMDLKIHQLGTICLVRTQNFPKNSHLLPLDTQNVSVRIAGVGVGEKLVFRKTLQTH